LFPTTPPSSSTTTDRNDLETYRQNQTLSSAMDVDSPPSTSNPLPNESNLPDAENPSIPAQAEGDELPVDDTGDVDMDGETASKTTLGVKQISNGKNGQGIASGRAGTSADKEGFGNMASFFQPRKANGSAAKGKAKEVDDAVYEDEIEKRGGLPWCAGGRPSSCKDGVELANRCCAFFSFPICVQGREIPARHAWRCSLA
jgi:hypothetical protein